MVSLPPFTKLLLYSYNPTLRLDLTGKGERDYLALHSDTDTDTDEEDISRMLDWQCEARGVLRRNLLEELEVEVSRIW